MKNILLVISCLPSLLCLSQVKNDVSIPEKPTFPYSHSSWFVIVNDSAWIKVNTTKYLSYLNHQSKIRP